MAEIKETKSPFAVLDKDVLQEWLGHPGTIELTRCLDDAIADAGNRIVERATRDTSGKDADLARFVETAGASIRALSGVRNLLEEAQRYANSI